MAGNNMTSLIDLYERDHAQYSKWVFINLLESLEVLDNLGNQSIIKFSLKGGHFSANAVGNALDEVSIHFGLGVVRKIELFQLHLHPFDHRGAPLAINTVTDLAFGLEGCLPIGKSRRGDGGEGPENPND